MTLHDMAASLSVLQECSSKLLCVEWLKGKSPLPGGSTSYTACVSCDDLLNSLCEVKHGRTFVKRGGGGRRGRGRGRRGRGRGRGRGRDKNVDPKMSFRDF
jgi:DNA topoisomerase-3